MAKHEEIDEIIASSDQNASKIQNIQIELKNTVPPERVLEVMETAGKLYGDMYRAIPVPAVILSENTVYPEGWFSPYPWFFKMLNQGNISPFDANIIFPGWLLWDKTRRPDYDEGKQLFGGGNDPLGEELKALRKKGDIDAASHVPLESRFYIFSSKLDQVVLPQHGKNLKIKENLGERVILPPYLLFNIFGNIFPDLMLNKVTTNEVMAENFINGGHLISGRSDYEPPMIVMSTGKGGPDDRTGFRPVIFFPSGPLGPQFS